MLKSMSIYQKDNKGTIKFNFVTSCFDLGAQSNKLDFT